MSAGLAASTVTPGSTAPEASLTTSTMTLASWADDGMGVNSVHRRNATDASANRLPVMLPSRSSGSRVQLNNEAFLSTDETTTSVVWGLVTGKNSTPENRRVVYITRLSGTSIAVFSEWEREGGKWDNLGVYETTSR